MPPTIGLFGDVMLGRGVARQLETVAPGDLWSPELRDIADSCDLVVCNLECCISERGAPTALVPSKPFFFRAPAPAIGSLNAIGVRAVTLANNHALDFGPEALLDTLEHLRGATIAAAGAGRDGTAARRGTVVVAGDANVGLVSVSDHPAEFAAGPNRAGIAHCELAAGMPAWLANEIGQLKERCDLVVACPHWGPNMTTAPARWQRTRARELLEAGADLVAGHSAHCFHGVARVAASLVLYDLGDALDDYAVDSELRNDLGVFAIWRPGGSPVLELVGLRLQHCYTELATGADADWIASRLRGACEKLGTGAERVGEQRFAIA